MKPRTSNLKVGDWVEVRSREEILRTLDDKGQLDGMPFMPEMFVFCGRKFQVYKRAHKTCDTVFPVRGRWVKDAVHLETRCNGAAHGGCEASCLLFWKEAWLKPAKGMVSAIPSVAVCTEADVIAAAQTNLTDAEGPTYTCQATQLPYATESVEWWDVRQYAEDYASGNVGIWQMLCGGMYFLYYSISRAGIGLGPAMRWFYDTFYPLWGGTPFPRKTGSIPEGQPTPVHVLNLQPGELVKIKTHSEILATLNTGSRNRGLYWDAEEVPHCGTTHQVLRRVTKIINERTGKMREMKTPCIILDSVVCQSRYSECRLFCPRSIYAYWREIWLERVGPETALDPVPVESVATVPGLVASE